MMRAFLAALLMLFTASYTAPAVTPIPASFDSQGDDRKAIETLLSNSSSRGSTWGWKVMQLLKVGGRWKIASEFYTGHA